MNNGQQTRDEHLSALLDNALSDQQLDTFMQDLKRDPIADAETAQRYNLMGEVMRDELSASSFVDISAAVHRAIEDEPALNETDAVKSTNKFSISRLLGNWAKPLTGVAVAASVSSVTLVSYNAMQTSEQAEPIMQVAQKTPVQPVDVEILRNVQVASTLNVSKPSAERQKVLNKYMLQHSGYASRSTMQGMMPYVRAASAKSQEIMREKNK